ncbi:hypothetical protein Har1130_13705 [Haloarcula sp. CBA1130]|uniref:hypothetical protein n=1 Tax=unclassified Haloarcula TaxID=2624677 RepID=UPI00124502E8|nr:MULTISPECIES: hypothetical protein [unclassified Haloarcula]KAA9399241.1 hypothetical protein Har1129_13805 [Haloarcula sp. CBA1129]KAA9403753.1 hypothetical protein Har1130_13705 [Haloarcula sp. CBA1130]
MRRGVAIAVVCLCLLSAGCTGLFGDETAATETVTPAPVPTADAPTSPAQRAPGVVGDRVVNATALGRAHVSQLSTTSYQVHHTRTVMNGSGLHSRVRTRASISAGYQSYTATRTASGHGVTPREIHSTWRDGRALRRTTVNGSTSTEVVADSRGIGGPPRPPRAALFFEPTFNDRLITLLSVVNITSIRPGDEVIKQLYGVSLYRIKGTGAADDSAVATRSVDRVSNVSLSATVTPHGVVRSYALQYTVINGSETHRVTEILRYSDLGTTDVVFEDQQRTERHRTRTARPD